MMATKELVTGESTRIAIRVDGSIASGTGHVMRCLALAQAWVAKRGRVVFITQSITPDLKARLERPEFELKLLGQEVSLMEDARQTANLCRERGIDWLIIDGYQFSSDYQQIVKEHGLKVVYIDDYGQCNSYSAEVLLNQNLGVSRAKFLSIGPQTRLMLGPKFALIREEFKQWVGAVREIPVHAKKILIMMGGSDARNVTAKVLDELPTFDGELRVVVGGSNPHLESIRARYSSQANLEILHNVNQVAELLAWADLAITAAGSTCWEMCVLGVPCILLSTEGNQESIGQSLASYGMGRYLGRVDEVDWNEFRSSFMQLVLDRETRRQMSQLATAIVDGRGCERVTSIFSQSFSVTILSDANSWLNDHVAALRDSLNEEGHSVKWIHNHLDLGEGDMAFLLSYSKIVPKQSLAKHVHNLVVHESAVPLGRGWSPLTWQILEGLQSIPMCLMEADTEVDCGDIYLETAMNFTGQELLPELRSEQGRKTVALCEQFISEYPFIVSNRRAQFGRPTYYRRRYPKDSEVDPHRTIYELFDQLRVADPQRYPSYFKLRGREYTIRIEGKSE